jgi:hypothetical protein
VAGRGLVRLGKVNHFTAKANDLKRCRGMKIGGNVVFQPIFSRWRYNPAMPRVGQFRIRWVLFNVFAAVSLALFVALFWSLFGFGGEPWTDILRHPSIFFIILFQGPVWVFLIAPVAWLVLCIRSLMARRQPDRWVGACRKCGYNLTGNISGVCPECGTPIPSKA